MPLIAGHPRPPQLRIVPRRTLELDPSAAQLAQEAPQAPLKLHRLHSVPRQPELPGFVPQPFPWATLAGLASVLWLAVALLGRAW